MDSIDDYGSDWQHSGSGLDDDTHAKSDRLSEQTNLRWNQRQTDLRVKVMKVLA